MTPGDDGRLIVEAPGELGQQATLADAGLADDEAEFGMVGLCDAMQQLLQRAEFCLTTDETRGEAAQLCAGSGQGGGGDRGESGLALPLK